MFTKILLSAPVDGHSQLYLNRALNKAGHTVETFDYRLYADAQGVDVMNDAFVAKKRGADLTLVLKGELIRPQNLEHTILWNFDSWYAKSDTLLEAARHTKLFLTPSDGLLPYYKDEGINAHYLPEAADPELHRPLGDVMTTEQKQAFGADVSFVGTVDGVPGRDEWLRRIGIAGHGDGMLDHQWLLRIWGSFPGKLSRLWHTGQRADGDAAHNCVVSSSKINLDRTRTPEIEGAISARVYRTMAAGGFLLMHRQVGLEKYYELGQEVAVYEDDAHCLTEIQHYLEHPEERARIANNGRIVTLQRDTWDKRVEELLELA